MLIGRLIQLLVLMTQQPNITTSTKSELRRRGPEERPNCKKCLHPHATHTAVSHPSRGNLHKCHLPTKITPPPFRNPIQTLNWKKHNREESAERGIDSRVIFTANGCSFYLFISLSWCRLRAGEPNEVASRVKKDLDRFTPEGGRG